MKVSKVIDTLNHFYKPDDEICISWWGKELFRDAETNEPCSDEQWLKAVEDFDAQEGYEHINIKVWDILEYIIHEKGDF
jgi:hypothetical protein